MSSNEPKQNNSKHEEAKEENIYDNDEAYMLNDDNNYDDDLSGENVNREDNNIDDNHIFGEDEINLDMNNEHQNEEEEDGTVRNKPDSNDNEGITNLITLNYISVCQCCKENFNSSQNIPYSMKCGHFFCKKCIESYFSYEDGSICCPSDGMVASSISQLKLLSNLIVSNEEVMSQRSNGMCQVHPEQKMSHYVEDTREVICVYCAFAKFKKNPKFEIKEINEKCTELIDNVDKVLEENQHHVEIIQSALKDIRDNKVNEENKVTALYDQIIQYIYDKKTEALENIDNMFTSNAKKLGEKLDYFTNKIEEAETLKNQISFLLNNESNNINETIERFNTFLKDSLDQTKLNLELTEFKFSHDDETKLMKYLNNFGDLKSKSKFVRFGRADLNSLAKLKKEREREDIDIQFGKMNISTGNKSVSKELREHRDYSGYMNDLNSSEAYNERTDVLLGRVHPQHVKQVSTEVNDSTEYDMNLRQDLGGKL